MNDSAQGRSAFIWDLPTLWALLGHSSERVGEWAASHILELYPEAAEQVLTILPRVPTAVAQPLLNSLQGLPIPASGAEPLLELIHGDGEAYLRAKSVGLLFRLGMIPGADDLDGLTIATLFRHLPDTDLSFEFLLQEWRKCRRVEDSLIQAMFRICNIDDLVVWLVNSSTRDLHRTVSALEKLWHIKLPPVSKVKNLAEAQRLLQDALTSTEKPGHSGAPGFSSLIAQVQGDRERFETLLQLTREFESADAGETPLLLGCVLAVYRDAACLNGLSDTSDLPEVWRSLTLRPWRGTEVGPELLALLGGQDPERTLSGVREAWSSTWAYFSYPFHVLKALNAPDRHQLIQEALDGKFGEAIAVEASAVETLILKDPPEMEALLDRWQQQLPEPDRLHILEEYPTEKTVQFLLEHFDHYMSQPFSLDMIEVMEEVASPDFLEALAREWRDGEEHLSRVIWFLAEVNGRERDKSIQHILRSTEDDSGQITEMLTISDQLTEVMERRPAPLPLRCTVCQRTYQYQLERVYVDKRSQNITIGQIVQCKGCGSLETCEITKETLVPLTTELLRVTMLTGLQKGIEEINTFVVGQPVVVTIGGKAVHSVSEAYHLLREAVEREPESAELHRRLGNVMRNGLRPDLAIPYYQEAIRLDQKEIDSVYSVAAILVEQERYWEAVPYVENLVTLCRDPELDEDLCRDIFEELLYLAAVVEDQIGRRIEIFPPPRQLPEIEPAAKELVELEVFDWNSGNRRDVKQMYQFFRHGTLPTAHSGRRLREPVSGLRYPAMAATIRVNKTGRNEPCHCGSGKKYKRCCGK